MKSSIALVLLFLVAVPPASAQLCGDCDTSGTLTILDSLAAARHASGLVTLVAPGFQLCDVDGTGTLTILDALVLARQVAGLPPPVLSCLPAGSARPAAFVSTPAGRQFGDVALSYRLADSGSSVCSIVVRYSFGGSPFAVATEAVGAPSEGTAGLSSSPVPGTGHVFVWDSMADLGAMQGTARIQITPSDGMAGFPGTTGDFLIEMPDATPPVIDLLTIDGILAIMNGSAASPGGMLRAPEVGFTIDVLYSDVGSGIDPASLTVTSDNPLGSVGAGVNFASAFAASGTDAHVTVSATAPGGLNLTFPAGTNTIRARISDMQGNMSAEAVITITNTVHTAANRPFETRQIWYLKTDRDIGAISTGPAPTGTTTVAGANGMADFDEDMRVFGLYSATPVAVPGFPGDSNARAKELVMRAMIEFERDLYGVGTDAGGGPVYGPDSVNIDFTATQPPGGPMTMGVFPYASFPFSQLAIGGFNTAFPVGGIALGDFDNNSMQENDATFPTDPFAAPISPTVAYGSYALRTYEVYFPFQGMGFGFEPFIGEVDPRYGGTVVGEDPLDPQILSPAFDRTAPGNPPAANTRFDDVMKGVMAYALAGPVAHECGHSMGLVKNGIPPGGLYGNTLIPGTIPGSFGCPAGSCPSPGHIDLKGNAMAGFGGFAEENIMATSSSFEATTIGRYAFTEIVLGYLRERLIE